MRNKILSGFLATTASIVLVGILYPITVYAEKHVGWVQEATEGAPVTYFEWYDDSDYTPEELIAKKVERLRDMGASEAIIQEEVAKLRAQYGLTTPASTSSLLNTETKSEPTYTQAQIDAAWEEVSKTEATCTEGAKTEYKNSLTGKTKTETTSDPKGHSYVESVTTEATCISKGTKTFTCTDCGDSYEEVIPATAEHTYETETVEATCTTDGHTTYTCSVCGDTYTETIAATGHQPGEAVVTTKAGLFTEGENVISCDNCGEVLKAIQIPQTFPLSLGNTIIVAVLVVLVALGNIYTFSCSRKKKSSKRKLA